MVSPHARSATNNATYRWLCKQAINIVATTYIQRNTNVLRTHRFKITLRSRIMVGRLLWSCLMGLRKNFLILLLTSWLTDCPKVRLIYRPRFKVFAGWTWSSN
uniref:Putative ovule protein n=1 Tax=Solanum chacoense TaxID=4108 RepID=A0A0V0HHP7_SOLCH